MFKNVKRNIPFFCRKWFAAFSLSSINQAKFGFDIEHVDQEGKLNKLSVLDQQ